MKTKTNHVIVLCGLIALATPGLAVAASTLPMDLDFGVHGFWVETNGALMPNNSDWTLDRSRTDDQNNQRHVFRRAQAVDANQDARDIYIEVQKRPKEGTARSIAAVKTVTNAKKGLKDVEISTIIQYDPAQKVASQTKCFGREHCFTVNKAVCESFLREAKMTSYRDLALKQNECLELTNAYKRAISEPSLQNDLVKTFESDAAALNDSDAWPSGFSSWKASFFGLFTKNPRFYKTLVVDDMLQHAGMLEDLASICLNYSEANSFSTGASQMPKPASGADAAVPLVETPKSSAGSATQVQ